MKKRILQICSSLEAGGGVQTVLQNYYSHMDTDAFCFDFIVHGSKQGQMEPWFEQFGAKIYHLPSRKKHPLKNIRQMAKIIREGGYDAVHCHQDYRGAIAMALAKRYGVPIRVIHSHAAFPPENAFKKLLRQLCRRWLKSTATVFLGCGQWACKWAYGEAYFARGKAKILRNAMELDRYAFREADRQRLRRELDIEDRVVLGNVGRFCHQKNHALLIDVFAEYAKHNDRAVLLLVGGGELQTEVATQVQRLGLEEKVKFLGIRKDVPALLSAMDVFVLSSRFEGLSLATIEVQANGLPWVCGEGVTDELSIAGCYRVTGDGVDAWCEQIDLALTRGRYDGRQPLQAAGYEIRLEAQKLENLYRTGNY